MELPRRKSNRLPDYSYSSEGCYFLTVCAVDKRPLFCRIQENGVQERPDIQLSNYGILVENQIQVMQRIYSDLRIDHHVIMPNHAHFLITLFSSSSVSTPANERIPSFISTLKRFTNKSSGYNLWHRSYHDHVIRDEADYLRRWKYIDENPDKWILDRFYTSDN